MYFHEMLTVEPRFRMVWNAAGTDLCPLINISSPSNEGTEWTLHQIHYEAEE